MERRLIGKAEHSTGGHADLFWSFRARCGYTFAMEGDCEKAKTCMNKPDYNGVYVKWSGYNDAYWWTHVAPSDARIRTIPCGRKFEIDFKTCEVFELIAQDFTHATTEEILNEIERRIDPSKELYDPGAITVHAFQHGEEGVIVRYVPYGQTGLDKKPETVQFGIYNARIIVVVEEQQ
jgi:hypothetical protein